MRRWRAQLRVHRQERQVPRASRCRGGGLHRGAQPQTAGRRGRRQPPRLPQRQGWHNVSAADINDYLRDASGGDFTAKDFRTWHATVLAAVGLAASDAAADSPTARKRAVARVVREVAGYLGNTPAVARASYIDPRVIRLYEKSITIAPALDGLGKGQAFGDVATRGHAERAVLRLLSTARDG